MGDLLDPGSITPHGTLPSNSLWLGRQLWAHHEVETLSLSIEGPSCSLAGCHTPAGLHASCEKKGKANRNAPQLCDPLLGKLPKVTKKHDRCNFRGSILTSAAICRNLQSVSRVSLTISVIRRKKATRKTRKKKRNKKRRKRTKKTNKQEANNKLKKVTFRRASAATKPALFRSLAKTSGLTGHRSV